MQPDWNRTYHVMFVKIRDDLRERQRNGAPYLAPDKLDAKAWRDAQTYVEGAIRREDEAHKIAKQRTGQAA
jgi:hypothetical protein